MSRKAEYMTSAIPICGVMVVDDHGIVREGLIAMLRRQVGVEVLGSATSGQDAILAAQRLNPAIISWIWSFRT